jgi:hypothetical protein
MTLSPLSRWVGIFSLTAAVLTVLSQVMRLGLGWRLGRDAATAPAHTDLLPRLARDGRPAARSDCDLHPRVRRPWPARPDRIRDRVPGHPDGRRRLVVRSVRDPKRWRPRLQRFWACQHRGLCCWAPSPRSGCIRSAWTLFGLAVLRAGMFSRPAAWLLLAGGLAGPLALSTPYQVGISPRRERINPRTASGRHACPPELSLIIA